MGRRSKAPTGLGFSSFDRPNGFFSFYSFDGPKPEFTTTGHVLTQSRTTTLVPELHFTSFPRVTAVTAQNGWFKNTLGEEAGAFFYFPCDTDTDSDLDDQFNRDPIGKGAFGADDNEPKFGTNTLGKVGGSAAFLFAPSDTDSNESVSFHYSLSDT